MKKQQNKAPADPIETQLRETIATTGARMTEIDAEIRKLQTERGTIEMQNRRATRTLQAHQADLPDETQQAAPATGAKIDGRTKAGRAAKGAKPTTAKKGSTKLAPKIDGRTKAGRAAKGAKPTTVPKAQATTAKVDGRSKEARAAKAAQAKKPKVKAAPKAAAKAAPKVKAPKAKPAPKAEGAGRTGFKQILAAAMGGDTMTVNEMLAALAKLGFKHNWAKPSANLAAVLSNNTKEGGTFEKVGRGKYRVRALSAPTTSKTVAAQVQAPAAAPAPVKAASSKKESEEAELLSMGVNVASNPFDKAKSASPS